jgi:hypothetical protein
MFTSARVKNLPDAMNVFAQGLVVDGVVCLHIEGVRQWQFIQFTGNRIADVFGNVAAECEINVGSWLRIALGARAKTF